MVPKSLNEAGIHKTVVGAEFYHLSYTSDFYHLGPTQEYFFISFVLYRRCCTHLSLYTDRLVELEKQALVVILLM